MPECLVRKIYSNLISYMFTIAISYISVAAFIALRKTIH